MTGRLALLAVVSVAALPLLACEPAALPAPRASEPVVIPTVTAPASSEQKFGARVFRVGERWSVRTLAEGLADDGGGATQSSEYEALLHVTVLSVVGGGATGAAPSRLELHFEKSTRAYQHVPKPTDLHGKTYVVDATSEVVRDTSGAEVGEVERELVRDAYPDVGTSSRVEQALPDGTLTPGSDAPGLAEAVLRSLHPRAWTFNRGRATFKEIDGGEAVFEISLDTTSARGLHLDVSGEARFRLADRQQTRLVLRGSYEKTEPPEVQGQFSIERYFTGAVSAAPAPSSDR
ncbi:MAG: hypothetical protein KC657_37155 [Myxococcales bacterium]|nr:hypothetical protein [Myxococcales bacterium]